MADCLLPPPPGSCVGLTAAGSTGLSSVSLSVVLCMGKTDSVVLSSHKNIWSIPPFWWYLEGLSQWPHVGLQINSEEVRFLRRSNVATTCLFTRLESLIWSQQGFWQRVSAENVIYEDLVVMGEISCGYCIVCMEKTKIGWLQFIPQLDHGLGLGKG